MTYGILIILFYIDDKDKKLRFFEKTLLLTNVSKVIVLRIYSFTLSNVEVNFNN